MEAEVALVVLLDGDCPEVAIAAVRVLQYFCHLDHILPHLARDQVQLEVERERLPETLQQLQVFAQISSLAVDKFLLHFCRLLEVAKKLVTSLLHLSLVLVDIDAKLHEIWQDGAVDVLQLDLLGEFGGTCKPDFAAIVQMRIGRFFTPVRILLGPGAFQPESLKSEQVVQERFLLLVGHLKELLEHGRIHEFTA